MRRTLFAVSCLLVMVLPAAAQEPPTGIRLQGIYDVRVRPLLAVRPFAGAPAIAAAVDSISTIVLRDLRFSDRYNMIESIPDALRTGDVDYRQWNSLRLTYLVTGEVTPNARGYDVRVVIHDVPFAKIVADNRYNLPGATDPDFRMATHAVSDHVVQLTVNAAGAAATRITFARKNPSTQGTNDDLLIVDSDGFGLRRIAGFGGQLYSPAWSPDGRRILYTINAERGWQLVERDVATGSQRFHTLDADMVSTPTYTPDGRKIAVSVWPKRQNRQEIHEYDIDQQCCMRRVIGQGNSINASPSFSRDGRMMAFMSNRVGGPAIYIAGADGSNPTILTPYVRGTSSDYSSPAWSPTGTRIAFHGDWNTRANGYNYQIMLGDASNPSAAIMQLTERGVNEDPSWAPDGRHLVFTGVGDGAGGLYVIDTESKIRRLLVNGANMRMADWSPALVRAADILVR